MAKVKWALGRWLYSAYVMCSKFDIFSHHTKQMTMNLTLAGSMFTVRADGTGMLLHSCLVLPSHTVSPLSRGTMPRLVITYSVCRGTRPSSVTGLRQFSWLFELCSQHKAELYSPIIHSSIYPFTYSFIHPFILQTAVCAQRSSPRPRQLWWPQYFQ